MTRRSMHRHEAAKAYVAWNQSTNAMVKDILRRHSIEPFEARPLMGRT